MNMYQDVLSAIKKSQINILTLDEYESANTGLVLRHDVDFSLHDALEMARLEWKNNISSYYFIMVDNPFYNIFEQNQKKIIEEIVSLGHNIGLHFDPVNRINLNKDLNSDISFLSVLLNINIRFVSFHRPGRILSENITFDSIRHTYEKCFFDDHMYVSDSSGCVNRIYEFIGTIRSDTKAQMLMHPIWWNFDSLNDFSVEVAFSRLVSSFQRRFINEAKNNCKAFNDL